MMAVVRRQAQVMSFADIFLMLTVLFVGLALLGLLIKRSQPAPAAGGGGGHYGMAGTSSQRQRPAFRS